MWFATSSPHIYQVPVTVLLVGLPKIKKQLNIIIRSEILSTGGDALSNYLTQKPLHYFSPFFYFVGYIGF
jgi:uncharacterized protein YhdP